MNKRLEFCYPKECTFKPLSYFVKSRNKFSSEGNYLKGMKTSFRNQKHERMTLVAFLSLIIYAVFPMNFLYSKINKFLPLFTIYLWLMSLWFYCLVRRQDPGIIPRLELLEGVRRIWDWRYHDKMRLISCQEKDSSFGNQTAYSESEKDLKMIDSQVEIRSNHLHLEGLKNRSQNQKREDSIFEEQIKNLESEGLNLNFMMFRNEVDPLIPTSHSDSKSSQLKKILTERNNRIDLALSNLNKRRKFLNPSICKTCKIFKPPRSSHCK